MSSNKPLVSFVIPIYNVEPYLEQCLDSVVAQTLQDWECILVDDGSPDNCGAICDSYAELDDRFIVIHKDNQGVSAARNDGLDIAKGKWLYIIDSDDWLEDDAAERLVKVAEQNGADCVMSYCVKMYQDGSTKRSAPFAKGFFAQNKDEIAEIQKYILYQPYSKYYTHETTNGYAAPWAKFVRTDIVKDNNIYFDPYLKGVFDDGLWSLCLLDHIDSLYYLPEKTYNYRIVESSLTNSFKPNAMDIQERGYQRIEEWLRETKKDSSFYEAYYAHIVTFFGGYLSRYFFNAGNPKNTKQVKKEIRGYLSRDPFYTAARKVNQRVLLPKDKFLAICERHKSVLGLKAYLFIRNIRPR